MIAKDQKILIVGHGDVQDRALFEYFHSQGCEHILSTSAKGLDVANPRIVEDLFAQSRPDYVFLSSTRSGGIAANQQNPGEFIFHNLASATQVIHLSHKCAVKKLLFLASSCIYPAQCRQPIREDSLLTGPLEPSNEPYSVAKIAGVKMCQAYRQQYGLNAVVMVPATLYGPQETGDAATSHVLSALIRKFHDAVQNNENEVVVWGSGRPRREFLFAEDFVNAALFLMNEYNGGDVINVGWGRDVSIRELAQKVAKIAGFKGKIVFDRTKPDGVMRKVLDCRRMSDLGWQPKVILDEGIRRTLEALKQN